MKNLISLKNFLFLSSILFILYSCTKDFEFDKLSTDNLSGEWAFPLINSIISIQDVLNDTTGIITTGADGFITLVYESNDLVSMDGKERTIIPDQEKVLTEVFSVADSIPAGIPAQLLLPFDFQFEMVDENHRIDSMYLKNGEYIIGLTTNLNVDNADVTLFVDNFIHIETLEPLHVTFNMDNPNGQELSFSESVDLTQYYVQFDNSVQQNKVIINAYIDLVTDDNPNLSPYYFNLENEFNNIEFDRFYGYIGENFESYSDTVEISIFNSTDLSNLVFGEGSVKLNLDVYNSLGIPITLDVSQLMAYNTVGNTDSINLNIDPNIIDINFPELVDFNEYALTEINTDEINVNQIMDISPDKLILRVNGLLNDDASPESVNYFADNSNLYVDASLELQLFGGISSFEIVDTIDFDPANFENFDALEFMIEVTNGFPINADIQLDFIDGEYNIKHSLMPSSETVIQSGIVGPSPEYRVTDPTVKKTFVLLDREGLDKVQESSQILFTAILSTENSQLVKIYDEYDIGLRLGAKVVYIY